jgi:hypothetical protein
MIKILYINGKSVFLRPKVTSKVKMAKIMQIVFFLDNFYKIHIHVVSKKYISQIICLIVHTYCY